MKTRKKIVDDIPIEDAMLAITISAKLLVVTDGTGVSLGLLPPEWSTCY